MTNIAESLVGNGDVHATAVGDGGRALGPARAAFDCVVARPARCPTCPESSCSSRSSERPTADLPRDRLHRLPDLVLERADADERRLAETAIVKDAHSPERLLDQTALVPAPRSSQDARGPAADARQGCTQPTRVCPARRC